MQIQCAGFLKIVATVFGGLLILGGIGLKWGLFPMVVNMMILDQIQLSPSNEELWETWVEPTKDLPVYMIFTFFNVTNPEEIKQGAQPEVKEIGPFSYQEHRRKDGIQFFEDEITFGSYISYELDESRSCATCTKDTLVTVINPALVVLPSLIETLIGDLDGLLPPDFPPIDITGLIDSLLEGLNVEITKPNGTFTDDLVTTQTANQLIFEGYESGTLAYVLLFLQELSLDDILPLPDLIQGGTFAFFKGKNGTADNGWYTINSGLHDVRKYQQIVAYNGAERLPEKWWGTLASSPSANRSGVTGRCHDLAGTEGSQFPPFVSETEDLWIFSADLCRSIFMSPEGEVDMDGVSTLQFRIKPEVLSFQNPDNACFCQGVEGCAQTVLVDNETMEEVWDLSECTQCKNGMLNLIGCQGAPVVISLPHFLDADKEIQEAIIGMKPDRESHTTYINVEKNTGLVLEAHKRIQVNVPTKKNDKLTYLKNIKEVIFPVLWVDEGTSVKGENLDKLKDALVTPFLAVDIGVGFMIGLGSLIIICVSILSICFNGKKRGETIKI